ncbi:nucleoside-diphosphate sugar epimerase/dehydratase [Fusobacterium sp. SYSU M8D902]|uniref:polysaccharide biosynthesis protein n=1 Tax=Fusobacterium sp. SYSU M8D902 TaxID=3159562 RepID=UPI0032E3BF14
MEFYSKKEIIGKMILDTIAIIVAARVAIFLKLDISILTILDVKYFLYYILIYLMISFFYKNFQISWSYIDTNDIFKFIVSHIITFILVIFYFSLLREEFSRQILLLVLFFSSTIQLLIRMFFRMLRQYKYNSFFKGKKEGKKAFVYGAGEAGVALIKESKMSKNFIYNIVGFIDDDIKKQKLYINGVRVYGGKEVIKYYARKLKIEVLIIAIPTLEYSKLKLILTELEEISNIEIKILPLIEDRLSDKGLINNIRDVKIEDLLGRDEVIVNDENIFSFIKGKTILITGGGGSIGSEISRQISKYNPKKLINIDINENSLYLLELEIKRNYEGIDLISEICNIRDKEKLDYLFSIYKPDIVFHAAAHKHVPLMEHSPEEAIKNNIFGTKGLVDIVDKYNVDRFVMISTDKAVNPTNIMGATKRACELIIEEKNICSNTKFMAVRFGNVLGSNGSVIPIFKTLLEEGRNLTVTHKEMTRYFMTISEAAQLVIEAGTIGNGGEIFILDMGEPVKIIDLAKNMIRFSKSKVGIDIIGLRPGEKLYEELLYDVNSAIKTENKKIFITKIEKENIDITSYLDKLKEIVSRKPKVSVIKKVMKEFITSYKEIEYK